MRFLFLNHNTVRGGGTFFRAYQVARGLVERGHSVTLLAISKQNRAAFEVEFSEGVEIVASPDLLPGRARTGWDPWDTLRRVGFVLSREWDVIHAWDCRPAVIFPALAAHAKLRQRGCKLFIDWCDWWGRGGTQVERAGGFGKLFYNPVETFFEEAFRTRADASTVISTALYDRAVRLGVQPETIHHLPQGCRVDYPKATAAECVRARMALNLPLNTPILLSIGTLLHSDSEIFYPAVRKVFASDPACSLIMIGRHFSVIPDDLKATGRIRETGQIPPGTVDEFMLACNALIVPMAQTIANSARWPSKVNPFLAAGQAVVITKVGDLPEILDRHHAAIVCEPTAEALGSALVDLLRNPHRYADRSDFARELAHNELAWPRLVEQLERVYLTKECTPPAALFNTISSV